MSQTTKESVGGSPLFSYRKFPHPRSISGLPGSHTAVLHITEECGVFTLGRLLWKTVPQEVMPGSQTQPEQWGTRSPPLSRAHKWVGLHPPLHSAIWAFALRG